MKKYIRNATLGGLLGFGLLGLMLAHRRKQ